MNATIGAVEDTGVAEVAVQRMLDPKHSLTEYELDSVTAAAPSSDASRSPITNSVPARAKRPARRRQATAPALAKVPGAGPAREAPAQPTHDREGPDDEQDRRRQRVGARVAQPPRGDPLVDDV